MQCYKLTKQTKFLNVQNGVCKLRHPFRFLAGLASFASATFAPLFRWECAAGVASELLLVRTLFVFGLPLDGALGHEVLSKNSPLLVSSHSRAAMSAEAKS